MAGTIVADTIQDGAGNSTSLDTAIYGSAKAWVQFNGNTGGAPSIRKSYNVSSVTTSGSGVYTVNFTNALSDANFAWGGSSAYNTFIGEQATALRSTTQIGMTTISPSPNATTNSSYVSIIVWD